MGFPVLIARPMIKTTYLVAFLSLCGVANSDFSSLFAPPVAPPAPVVAPPDAPTYDLFVMGSWLLTDAGGGQVQTMIGESPDTSATSVFATYSIFAAPAQGGGVLEAGWLLRQGQTSAWLAVAAGGAQSGFGFYDNLGGAPTATLADDTCIEVDHTGILSTGVRDTLQTIDPWSVSVISNFLETHRTMVWRDDNDGLMHVSLMVLEVVLPPPPAIPVPEHGFTYQGTMVPVGTNKWELSLTDVDGGAQTGLIELTHGPGTFETITMTVSDTRIAAPTWSMTKNVR